MVYSGIKFVRQIVLILSISILSTSCCMRQKEMLKNIYSYYPRNIMPYESLYKETFENKKLIEVLEKPPFKDLAAKVYEDL